MVIVRVILLTFINVVVLSAEKAWSPLNYVRPDKELALQLQRQQHWLSEHSDKLKFEDFTGIREYLNASKVQLEGEHQECIKSLVDFAFDLAGKRTYTYQVLDSDGKLHSGLMLGNIKWNGRFHECLNAHSSTFDGKWCAVEFGAQSSPYGGGNMGLNIGVCVPRSCSQDYLQIKLQPLADKVKMVMTVNCPVQQTIWTPVDILSFTIFILLTALVLFGTIYDVIIGWKFEREQKALSINGDGTENVSLCRQQNLSAWSRTAISFSIRKNTQMLFDTSPKPGNIEVLHGMRFLSITWVMLGHVFTMTSMYIDNSVDFFNWYLTAMSFQTIGNATYSVDSFFFLSGLLVTYLGVREITRTNGRLNVFLMYLHRYIRLTPAYAFVILFIVGFYGKLGNGPMWPQMVEGQKDICDKYWWTNLLYINNLYPKDLFHECFALGWYLANDMQFYLLAPISVYLLYRWPKIGMGTLLFGIFGSMLVTGVISTHYEEQPSPVGIGLLVKAVLNASIAPSNGQLGQLPNLNGTNAFWSDTYTKPWCRIGVYLIGMMTGYVLYTTKCRIKMNKLAVGLGWIVAAFLQLAVLYGLWGYIRDGVPLSIGAAAFYNAVSRPVWAVGLAWVTIACACGYGGPVHKFLGWKIFVPLSRLTYSIYLGHTLVLNWWFSTQETSTHYSNKDYSFFYIAILVVSIAFAYVLYMLVEAPLINLQKVVFSHRKENCPVEAVRNPLLGDSEANEDD